jgi:DNA polymerase-3 subunit gamma/tau
MAYQVLARKYRPRHFEALVGQEHVLRALVNALDHDRLHHAFLFTGTRGVGKTTIARILSKSLNCEQGVSSKPCGECSACREIDEGRFVDLIEVDAASRTKVDDTRELLDNVQYAPTRGRYKVYLIDEVHMLSTHSFNALLKTLEEPPPHVKFLLATTDPQKLPVTVLSRCLQFNLKRLPAAMIREYLAEVLKREEVEAEVPAIALIARAADGSMRDGLSLLDQAIAFGGGRLGESDVRAMLGTVERDHVMRLLDRLADGDAAGLLQTVADLDTQAPDYLGLLEELTTALQHIAVLQLVPDAGTEWDDREALAGLAARLAAEEVQLYYQTAILARRDLPLAPEPRAGMEMALLRMLAFRPADVEVSGAPTKGAAGKARTPPSPGIDPGIDPGIAPGTAPGTATSRPATRSEAAETRTQDATEGQGTAARAAPQASPSEGRALPDWNVLVEALGLKGLAQQLAAHCSLEGREQGLIRLRLDPTREQVRTDGAVERLERALSRYLGESVKLRIELAQNGGETPADREARLDADRLEEAREAIARDPNVRALQEAFDARPDGDSVRPRDRRH